MTGMDEMRRLKNMECRKATCLKFASIFIFVITILLNPKIALSQDSIPDTIKTIDGTIIAAVLGFVPQDSPTPSALVYKLKESEPPKTINLSQIVEVVDGQSGNMIYQNNISKAMKVVFTQDSIPDTIKTVDETILGIVMGFVPENSSFPRALVYRPNESEPAITLLLNQVVEVVDGRTGICFYRNSNLPSLAYNSESQQLNHQYNWNEKIGLSPLSFSLSVRMKQTHKYETYGVTPHISVGYSSIGVISDQLDFNVIYGQYELQKIIMAEGIYVVSIIGGGGVGYYSGDFENDERERVGLLLSTGLQFERRHLIVDYKLNYGIANPKIFKTMNFGFQGDSAGPAIIAPVLITMFVFEWIHNPPKLF